MKSGTIAGLARSLMWTASDVLGSGLLEIDGGGSVVGVQGDTTNGDEYPDDVAENQISSSVVVTSEEFLYEYTADIHSYIGKQAFFDGETYRVLAINNRKAGFYTITLGGKEQGA